VAGQDHPAWAPEVGPGDQGVLQPGDLQPGGPGEKLLEVVGYRRLVVADRGYGNQLGGQLEQIAGGGFRRQLVGVDQQTLSQRTADGGGRPAGDTSRK
jgi:hypothetical protein